MSADPLRLHLEPTRAAALARLEAFLPAAGRDYAERRNDDTGPGPRDNVSLLSPFVRHRLLSEPEVLTRVLERHGIGDAGIFVQEVFWRSYWKGWLEQRPAVWTAYLDALDAQIAALRENVRLSQPYDRAVAGTTGIECFDAWARELVETGYLHNHARMWFASIWIFTLRLPWELGADFFLRHLLDGDPATNTLSWRWVAGLHTRGKTYLARPDNIARHTGGRFSPTGLARVAEPLDGPAPPLPGALPDAAQTWPDERFLMLLTEEDATPEQLPLPVAGTVVAVATVSCASLRSVLPVAPAVLRFTEGALADAGRRATPAHAAPICAVSLDPETLAAAASTAGVRTVATPCAPVGPAATWLGSLEGELGRRGIALVRVRRRFDTVTWPHATRGFFALKEAIPSILREAGIG